MTVADVGGRRGSEAHASPGSDGRLTPRYAMQQEVDRRLRAAGQRPSRTRRLLVWALADAERPCSVAQLIEATPGVAQSSVYRNLRVLEAVGVVAPVASGDDLVRWELDESLTQRHHHHLLCRSCGLVLTYEPPVALEATVVEGLALVANLHEFEVDGHRLDVVGRCRTCRRTPG